MRPATCGGVVGCVVDRQNDSHQVPFVGEDMHTAAKLALKGCVFDIEASSRVACPMCETASVVSRPLRLEMTTRPPARQCYSFRRTAMKPPITTTPTKISR